MSFKELCKSRFSCRSFLEKEVPERVINQILEVGNLAPTACNKQPQRIYVITSDDGISKLRKCTKCHFNAPTAILVCYDKDECWQRKYDGKFSGDIDASIVTTHMMIAAEELGVGTTWVMHFIPEAIVEEFQFPQNIEPVAILVMGYPSENATPADAHNIRKDLGQIITRI